MRKPASIDEFVGMALKSQLISRVEIDAQLARFQHRIAAANDGPESMKRFSDWLSDCGALTRWQCEKLLAGRWNGFFIDGHKILEPFDTERQPADYRAEVVATGRHVVMRITPKTDRKQNGLPPEYAIVKELS